MGIEPSPSRTDIAGAMRKKLYKTILEPIPSHIRKLTLSQKPFFGNTPEGQFLRNNMKIYPKNNSFTVGFNMSAKLGDRSMSQVIGDVQSNGINVRDVLERYTRNVLIPQLKRRIKRGR